MRKEALKTLEKLPYLRDSLVWAVVAFSGFGMLYTLIHLGSRSLWWDELFSMTLANPSTPAVDSVQQIRSDVHPPLYFFGLRAWLVVLDASSEFAARAFSLFPCAFAVAMSVWGLKRPFDRNVQLLWAGLFFTSFGLLWYLQEARMYAAMISQAYCGCLILMMFDAGRIEQPRLSVMIALIVTFVILPLFHWFSFAFAGLTLLTLMFRAWRRKASYWAAIFFALGMVLAVSGATWIISNFGATAGEFGNYGDHIYGGELSLWGLRASFQEVLFFALGFNPILMLTAAYGAGVVLKKPIENISLLNIAICSAILGFLIIGVSIVSPMYQARNFMWLIGPLSLVSAVGFVEMSRRAKLSQPVLAGVYSATMVLSLAAFSFAERLTPLQLDDWRGAGQFIASSPHCSDSGITAAAQWVSPEDEQIQFRLTQRMFGYYYGAPERIRLVPLGGKADIDQTSDCNVVLWVAQLPEDKALELAQEILGPAALALPYKRFKGHSVFMKKSVSPNSLDRMPS